MMNAKAPAITQVEFEDDDFELAERIAKRLGFTQTAYTSTSALWGLYCLPDRETQKKGCIIKTKELGMLFVQDIEDMLMYDLMPKPEPRKVYKKATFNTSKGSK